VSNSTWVEGAGPASVIESGCRTAIYARYSSDLQSAASIVDQVRLCRARIEREKWTLVATYRDQVLSGATRLRPGYQKLLEDARKNGHHERAFPERPRVEDTTGFGGSGSRGSLWRWPVNPNKVQEASASCLSVVASSGSSFSKPKRHLSMRR
jgi:Resolvase, N terminal domain